VSSLRARLRYSVGATPSFSLNLREKSAAAGIPTSSANLLDEESRVNQQVACLIHPDTVEIVQQRNAVYPDENLLQFRRRPMTSFGNPIHAQRVWIIVVDEAFSLTSPFQIRNGLPVRPAFCGKDCSRAPRQPAPRKRCRHG